MTPRTLSASQVATYRDCQRKWAWNHLDGFRPPQHPSAALGEAVHAVLEAYLRDGTMPDPSTETGRIAASGLQHLPKPRSVQVETELELARLVRTTERGDFETVTYKGRIDFTGPATVGDHKTTSGLGWAKTPEQLRGDPQVAIYGAWRAQQDGCTTGGVVFRWVYYQTKGAAKSKLVHLTLSHDEIEIAMAEIDVTAREMLLHHKNNKKALDLLPTPTHCDAYGGCAYRERCNLTPEERLKGHLAMATLREKMLAAKAAKNETAPVVTPAPAVETPATAPKPAVKLDLAAVTPPTSSKPSGLAAKLRAAKQAAPAPEPALERAAQQEEAAGRPAAATALRAADPEPTQAPKKRKAFVLYVDCRPIKGEISLVVDLPDLVAEVAEGVAMVNKVAHYRFIGYGQAVGALETGVESAYNEGMLDLGDGVVLDTKTQIGQDLLGVMTRLASTVVRGV